MRYSYDKFNHNKYYGRCLLLINFLGISNGNRRYKISEYYLAINDDDQLGFIGLGNKWFLNYACGESGYAFNPINYDDIMWSPYHNAYVKKIDEIHFLYPVMIDQYYFLIDDEKYIDEPYSVNDTKINKLPKFNFMKSARY